MSVGKWSPDDASRRIVSGTGVSPSDGIKRQRLRLLSRTAFFALFVLAPVLDVFRYDLTLGHAILFGHDWKLGLAPFESGVLDGGEASLRVLLRGFLPILLGAGLFLWLAWRYGRLYCGWLCPHFSVVEAINGLMRRASGKPSVWEPRPLPPRYPDGRPLSADRRYWWPTILVILAMSLLWSVSLLTYLLPPAEIWGNLARTELTRNQAIFISVATLAFTVEFTLARHLFCRYGCAVGIFQSLAWMANRRALVVKFDSAKAVECGSCFAACDHACPMRLRPRGLKRHMFTCTQCTQCLSACEAAQGSRGRMPLLTWVQGDEAAQIASFAAPRATAIHSAEAKPTESSV